MTEYIFIENDKFKSHFSIFPFSGNGCKTIMKKFELKMGLHFMGSHSLSNLKHGSTHDCTTNFRGYNILSYWEFAYI